MPLTNEDKVIIFIIALGLLGGVALFFMLVPPIIISVFLAMGVSALVYRFLGGIKPEANFVIKTITIGGTLGALITVAIVINSYLCKEVAVDINDLFQPSVRTWTAIGPGPLGMAATSPMAAAPNEMAVLASSSEAMQQIFTLVFMVFQYFTFNWTADRLRSPGISPCRHLA